MYLVPSLHPPIISLRLRLTFPEAQNILLKDTGLGRDRVDWKPVLRHQPVTPLSDSRATLGPSGKPRISNVCKTCPGRVVRRSQIRQEDVKC
jgi:hypothetical protein